MTVDLVDDDESFREEVSMFFKKNSLPELRLYERPEPFLESDYEKVLSIIDYRFTNSGWTGVFAAEEIKKKYPDVKIIIVTGMDFNHIRMYNLQPFKMLEKGEPSFYPDLLRYVKEAIEIINEEREIKQFASKKNIKTDGRQEPGPSD